MNATATAPQMPPPPAPKGARKPITIVLAVLGGLVLVAMLFSTVWSALANLSVTNSTQSADAQGVTSLEVEANAGRFTLQFTDTTEAVLDVRSSRGGEWKLERQGTKLAVSPPGGWDSWCFFGCGMADSEVTLTLPQTLNDGELNADLTLEAGSFLAEGNFNALALNVAAGSLEASGSARSVDVELGAGRAELAMADVSTAILDISAGRFEAELTGAAPDNIQAEVSAGQLVLSVPDLPYDVRSNVSAGSVDNKLQTSTESVHEIQVEVSAGNAVLRPGEAPSSATR